MTQREAERLADKCRAYWEQCGSTQFDAWIEKEIHGRHAVWRLKTNLVNGMPPDFKTVTEQIL